MPNTIVLIEKIANQFYGEENPLGKILFWQRGDTNINLEVTGVVAKPARNTNISFEVLISMETKDSGFDGEQVVTVQLPNKVWQLREEFTSTVSNLAGVRDAAIANGFPGGI